MGKDGNSFGPINGCGSLFSTGLVHYLQSAWSTYSVRFAQCTAVQKKIDMAQRTGNITGCQAICKTLLKIIPFNIITPAQALQSERPRIWF